jgi:hypothetical protein
VKVELTLLVPRQPQNASHPYALQLLYPFSPSLDDTILLVEVRLIDPQGRRASKEETWQTYRPEEWRAATQQEQQEYLQKHGSPKLWFATMFRTYQSVYCLDDAGDESTNNGQTWAENLDEQWDEEEKLRDQFREETAVWREKVKGEMLRRFERWGEA